MAEIDNSKNPNVNKVFTSADGTEWYCFIDPLKISPVRGLSAEKARRFMDMKITEKTLKELIREIKVAAGQNDIVKAFSIIEEINFRLQFITEEESVLDLVFIYYFLKDENPNMVSDYHMALKRKILSEDMNARTFFLQIGLSLMSKFSNIPDEDLSAYLIRTKELANRIYRYLQIPNPSDLTNNLKN